MHKFGLRPVDLPKAVCEALAALPSKETSILVFPGSRGGYVRARLVHNVSEPRVREDEAEKPEDVRS